MDGDELLALLISLAIAAVGAVRWYASLIRVTTFASPARHRLALGVFPLLCILFVYEVLACCAAREVRQDATYQGLFLIGGAAWLSLATLGLRAIDIHPRDDAIETRNPAAVMAVCGMWLGATLCYTGANIGEGPTVWTTYAPAAAATLALFVSLLFLQFSTRISEAITVDRDIASSIRLVGFLVAAGMVLGRAAAGDFHSWDATWRDFIDDGWPVVPLLAVAVLLQQLLRPRPDRPEGRAMTDGLLPALAMILVAAFDYWILGLPDHCIRGG